MTWHGRRQDAAARCQPFREPGADQCSARPLDRSFAHRTDDHAHCLAVFAGHSATGQKTIAPERLLVFDVKQG